MVKISFLPLLNLFLLTKICENLSQNYSLKDKRNKEKFPKESPIQLALVLLVRIGEIILINFQINLPNVQETLSFAIILGRKILTVALILC